MTPRMFRAMVQEMRAAQQRFFANRSRSALAEARKWERKVDEAIAAYGRDEEQAELFVLEASTDDAL